MDKILVETLMKFWQKCAVLLPKNMNSSFQDFLRLERELEKEKQKKERFTTSQKWDIGKNSP